MSDKILDDAESIANKQEKGEQQEKQCGRCWTCSFSSNNDAWHLNRCCNIKNILMFGMEGEHLWVSPKFGCINWEGAKHSGKIVGKTE